MRPASTYEGSLLDRLICSYFYGQSLRTPKNQLISAYVQRSVRGAVCGGGRGCSGGEAATGEGSSSTLKILRHTT